MTEPSDEELERAERIRKLRSGGARSRGHEMRERRRESAEGETAPAEAGSDEAEGGSDEAGSDEAEGESPDTGGDHGGEDAADEESGDSSDQLPAGGEVDVLSMAAALPEDGSLFVVPIREGLRREFNKIAEQLHLRYGFQYNSDLDADMHVRPLALYLGVRALADSDVETVRELLESVEELDGPDSG